MTNLIAQITKLGQLTLGNAQYNDFADAAQQFLSVVR